MNTTKGIIRNNYRNIFIVLGALKSLLRFPFDIDVNDISNCRTNYLLRRCRKKAISNIEDYLNTRLLIVTFHEIAIKYDTELKIQFVLSDISTNHNVGSSRSLHLKFCQMIYLFSVVAADGPRRALAPLPHPQSFQCFKYKMLHFVTSFLQQFFENCKDSNGMGRLRSLCVWKFSCFSSLSLYPFLWGYLCK